jgi:hypothetical protein
MPDHGIPQGFPGRAEMRAEQADLADRVQHGNFACIDRFNLLSQVLAALDGYTLPIGKPDDHHDQPFEPTGRSSPPPVPDVGRMLAATGDAGSSPREASLHLRHRGLTRSSHLDRLRARAARRGHPEREWRRNRYR